MSSRPTIRNPHFNALLDRMRETHDKKSHDYAQDSNVYSNFQYAASLSEPFKDEVDKCFVNLIGVKLARLSQLLSGKIAKNESVDDTFLDLTNYCAIWASYHRSLRYDPRVITDIEPPAGF